MPSLVLAQNDQSLKNYTIKVWSNREGLPSNNLSHIVKDQRGYLWISTYDGCVRFDGNEFRSFNSQNIPELTTSAVHSVLSLPDSSMYFSTQSSGLLYYKNGIFSSPFVESELPDNIMVSYMDANEVLWIGSGYSGLYFIKNNQVEKYFIPEFENVRISGIVMDSQNILWVSSEGEGVAKISNAGYELFNNENGLLSNVVHTVARFRERIYFGTAHGLSIYDNNNWSEDKRFTDVAIFYILPDSDDNLWIATVLGLAKLNSSNEYDFISVEDGLPERAINGIEIDQDNNIWLATYRGGLAQLKLSDFTNYTVKDGLTYHNINIITEAPDGRFFVGDNDGGVNIIDNGVISNLELTTDMKNIIVKDVLVEENGTIWIGSYKGLIRKDANGEKLFDRSNGLNSNKTRRILKNEDGSIWIGSRRGGVDVIDIEGNITNISAVNGLGSDFVFCLEKSPNGDVLVGTANVGLNVIHSDHKIDVINPDNIFSGKSIFNIYIENEKSVWLATNVGLYYYDFNNFYLINPSKGLPAESIFDVIEDNNGNLWLTSILGIIKIKKEEVHQLVKGEIDRISSIIYDDSDGMVTRECTGVTKSLLAKDGRIWIPTIKGISILETGNESLEKLFTPTVFIENLVIDDIPIDNYSGGNLNSKIVIDPGHRSYIFKYTTLSMHSPGKVKFKYKLDGFDEEWILSGTERQAKYTNLPHGSYSFMVMASNNSGVWNDNFVTQMIVVVPFYYETKTFFILLLIIFILFTYTIYTYQTKKVSQRNRELIKVNAELDSFAYSVSHDLKAPLTSIQGLLNVARLDDNERAPFYYDRIEKSIDKLDNFIKDIIDYSKNARLDIKKEQVNVKNLIEDVLDGLSHLNEEKEIKNIIEVDPNLVIETDKTRIVFIFNNLISNAYRYADLEKDEPFVLIKAFVTNGKLEFSFADNGQGIEQKHHTKIFDMFYRANEKSSGSGLGLYIVNECVIKFGGNIALESEVKVGTTITVVLPQ